ncbi:MAG: DUF177 domain-containing protein [Methylococcales bacterium]|nr:DUF177 domain-containing protein [Methylococcales bacterium]
MSLGISQCFDPFVIAERGRTYRGVIALGELDRLAGCIFSDHGEVGYELTFSKEGSVFVVSGQVKADLILECQVCLEAVVLPVSTDTRLGIVGSLDEVGELSDAYEPLLVTDKKIALKEILEEELLLEIPLIARHDGCKIAGGSRPEQAQEKDNPFSILAELKPQGDQ